jgi:mycofactocin precursor
MSPTVTAPALSEPAVDAPEAVEPAPAADDAVLADLLVEEISIDGMCGVY